MGIEKKDKGQVSIKKGSKVGYLDQVGSSINDNRTVYEILKSAFSELNEMEKKIGILQKKKWKTKKMTNIILHLKNIVH